MDQTAALQIDLETVKRRLDDAAGLMVRMNRAPFAHCVAVLNEAAVALARFGQAYPASMPSPPPDSSLIQQIRAIQNSTRQVRRLLDSAVAFSRGWLAAGPLDSPGYTAEGVLSPLSEPGLPGVVG